MSDLEFRTEPRVTLLRWMGGDDVVAQSARVSTGAPKSGYEGLVRRLVTDRHGCYDAETEVLTSTGWIDWPKITGQESFTTLNLTTNEVEYQFAERLVVREAQPGEMIHFKTSSVDLLVTADHRMVAARRTNTGWQSPELVPAHELEHRPGRFAMGGGFYSGWSWHNPEMAELLGFIIADGHVPRGDRHGSISFNFGVNSSKSDWLRERCKITDGTGGRYYMVGVSGDLMRLAKLTYTPDGSRCIPREVLQNASPETMASVLDGYLRGDGNNTKRSGIADKVSASTTSRQLADDLMEAGLRAGRVVVETKPDTDRIGAYGTKAVYKLSFYGDRNTRTRIGWTRADREHQVVRESYDGMVYCVTVPNGTLYVRRNGKPAWCGNTPFEHSVFTFEIETSIMVARESHRHRIASISEASLRYMEGLPVVYVPGPERHLIQKPGTKQMDYVTAPGSAVLRHDVDVSFRWAVGHAWAEYQFMLRSGVLREVARGVLPLCFGTKWHLTINARSLMNYLSLRVEDGDAAQVSHPQFEIEQVAMLMEGYFAELMPVTYDAFIAGGRLVP